MKKTHQAKAKQSKPTNPNIKNKDFVSMDTEN
jgi:hypothetical protein